MNSSTVLNPYYSYTYLTDHDYFDVNLSSIKLSSSPSTHLDGNESSTTTEFLAQFETNLLKLNFNQLFEYYEKSNTLNVLKCCINDYFHYLQSRLMKPNCTYLNVIEPETPYAQYNLASYGQPFWQLLEQKIYPKEREVLRNYSILIVNYLSLSPKDVITDARLEIFNSFKKIECLIERSVSHGDPDMKSIMVEAFQFPNEMESFSTLEDLVDRISLPTKRKNLFDLLQECFKYPMTEKISPRLLLQLSPINGDLSTGRNIDCTDVHFYPTISFDSVSVELDSDIIELLSKLLIALFKLKFGLIGVLNRCSNDDTILVEFDIGEIADRRVYGGKLRICLNTEFVMYPRTVNFYICRDRRFVPLTLLLKYWFLCGNLLKPNDPSNEAFVLLIIFFLQKTKPPVLPNIEDLVFDLSPTKVHVKSRSIAPKYANRQRIHYLVKDFVDFYLCFNFRKKMIDPWLGCARPKAELPFDIEISGIDDIIKFALIRCFSVQRTDEWQVGLRKLQKLANDGKIECHHLWNPRYFANSGYEPSEPPVRQWLSRQPHFKSPALANPYFMTKSEFEQLKCEIDNLELIPKNYPPKVPESYFFNKCKFPQDFIYTAKTVPEILGTYKSDLLKTYIKNIVHYFTHLQARLQEPNLNYETLLQSSELGGIDFCSFGPSFWKFLVECELFPGEILSNYSILIYHYLKMIPESILKVREQIVKIHIDLINAPKVVPKEIDYKWITYKYPNISSLHESICQMDNVEQQIDHILEEIYNPNQAKHFVEIIERLSQHPKLVPLKPNLIFLGSLQSGLSTQTFNNTFEFHLNFESLGNDRLDWSTSVLMLQLIELVIKLSYNLDGGGLLPNCLGYRFDSIKSPDGLQKYLRFEINTDRDYAKFGLLVNQFTKVEPRFGQVFLLLQYWAKNNGIGHYNKLMNCMELEWFIIFALQNTNPPLLFPVESTPTKSRNRQSTTELIVHFFQFYSNFGFENLVICPRNSCFYSKVDYETMMDMKLYPSSASAFVEDPFTQQVIYCTFENTIENEVARFRSQCAHMLKFGQINSVNCLQVLTNRLVKHLKEI